MKSAIALAAVVTCFLHVPAHADTQGGSASPGASENAPPKAVRVVVEPSAESSISGSRKQALQHVRAEEGSRANRLTAHAVKPPAPAPAVISPPAAPPQQ